MKILLLGHKGYLGSYLHNNLKCDTLDNRNVYPNGFEYDYVINCIGKAELEYCEKNIETTNYCNWLVIEDIKKHYSKAKIINFSSYYVYDSHGLNTETSPTTNQYAYTNQKLKGENLITNGVTFRLGKLFGNPYVKQNKLTEYIISSNNLTLDSVLFNPTSLEQVLKVINYELSEKNMFGVYNLSNFSYTCHYDYGIKINEILGTNKKITRVEKLDRMFHNYGKFLMDTTKLNNIMSLTHWEVDLNNFLKKL
jgi:dTDP-4-dehydrorhamnose reductase